MYTPAHAMRGRYSFKKSLIRRVCPRVKQSTIRRFGTLHRIKQSLKQEGLLDKMDLHMLAAPLPVLGA
uniref:Uncharacterized protein n=1 Tax=Picea glauca TaxID=3330 RepID=A0A117NI57_PICGL|nr:hypothetical protein ABT39_MTgene3996 [Picea glauca]